MSDERRELIQRIREASGLDEDITDETIEYFGRYGSVPEGSVSADHDTYVEDRLAEGFDACHTEVGGF